MWCLIFLNFSLLRNARIRVYKHSEETIRDVPSWREKDVLTESSGKYWRILVSISNCLKK
jgi:hypothetical protein